MEASALNALSPVDGRYAAAVAPLREYFSEAALIRERIRVEALWFLRLTEAPAALLRGALPVAVRACAAALARDPAPEAPGKVKDIERRINHDVKAVEYFVRETLSSAGAGAAALELVHFGCTSEDINNLSYARLLRSARAAVLLPELRSLEAALRALAEQYAELPMLARTHGQSASPTTFGKEMANVGARLARAPTLAISLPSGTARSAISMPTTARGPISTGRGSVRNSSARSNWCGTPTPRRSNPTTGSPSTAMPAPRSM